MKLLKPIFGSDKPKPLVVLLTPVKDAEHHARAYFERIRSLRYPHACIAIGLLEGDSSDGSYETFCREADRVRSEFHSVQVWKKDFHFTIPEGMPRWMPEIQMQRRAILAKCRNHLLSRALGNADWALWLDVDVIEFPSDVLERLISYDRDIVHPNCVREYGGPCFDLNAWADQGTKFMHDFRGGPELVRLDSVGGTMLLVRADCHRNGLNFPTYLHGGDHPAVRPSSWHKPPREAGEIETEGLGIMAQEMGYTCWGVPGLEIKHSKD
jgi:hypothetical protein